MALYLNNEEVSREELDNIFLATLDELKLPNVFDVELNFVDIKTIKELNSQYRKINKETDVLSFPAIQVDKTKFDIKDYPYDIDYETGMLLLGEILICTDIAKQQAKEYNHTFKREISYLFLHGLLHLLGYDHLNDNDKKEMRVIEEKILNKLDIKR